MLGPRMQGRRRWHTVELVLRPRILGRGKVLAVLQVVHAHRSVLLHVPLLSLHARILMKGVLVVLVQAKMVVMEMVLLVLVVAVVTGRWHVLLIVVLLTRCRQ